MQLTIGQPLNVLVIGPDTLIRVCLGEATRPQPLGPFGPRLPLPLHRGPKGGVDLELGPQSRVLLEITPALIPAVNE